MASNTALTIYRPHSWDDVYNDRMALDGPAPVVIDQAPQWLIDLHRRMQEAEADLRVLATETTVSTREDSAEIQRLKLSYSQLAEGVQNAYDILKRQGDLEKEWTGERFIALARASNEFGGQVWATISGLRTDLTQRTEALDTGRLRLESALSLVQQAQDRAINMQVEWNRNCETWAQGSSRQSQLLQERLNAVAKEQAALATKQKKAERAKRNERERLVAHILKTVNERASRGQTTDARTVIDSLDGGPDTMEMVDARNVPLPSSSKWSSPAPSITGGNGGRPPTAPGPPDDDSGSSSSSASEGSEDDDASRWAKSQLRKARKKLRRSKATDLFLARLLNQQTVSTPTQSRKEPPIEKPQRFSGEDLTKFRGWWQAVKEYLHTKRDRFQDDKDRIFWLGSMLTGRAQTWHQARHMRLSSALLDDNWRSYQAALEEHFTDKREIERDLRRMKELVYKGNVDDYLLQIEELNGRVQAHGVIFRDLIKAAMPAEILKMVYSRHGKIPNDDLEFVSSLREAGAVTEEMKKDEHLRYSRKDQEKGGHQEKSQGTPKERSNSKDNHRSKDQPKKDARPKDHQGAKSKPPQGDRVAAVWANGREALAGVPQADIDKARRENKDCLRCGRDGHKMLACFARKSSSGSPLPEAPARKDSVSATKRKRTDDDDEPAQYQTRPPTGKRQMVAAVRAEDMAMSEAPPPIWAADSSDEEDF
jgi:hypothetical protein